MHQGPGAGLGAQPLLLSGDDPDQGCEPDRALRGFGDRAANGAAAWSIMTASAKAKAASRAGSSSPTGSGSTATMSPRCAGCCRRRGLPSMPMCISCARRRCWRRSPRRSPSCSRRIIIGERMEGMLKSYDFVTRRDARLFLAAPAAGRARFATSRSTMSSATRAPPRRSSARAGGARIQVRRVVGDARCALSCLCRAEAHSARRLRAAGQEHV